MRNKLRHHLIFIALLAIHLVWLFLIREQITTELVFPVWLLSNASAFVSEIQTIYPPALFYLISFIYSFTANLHFSFQLTLVVVITSLDSILYYYLKNRFGFKYAALGFLFYIMWQVFCKGNYLWFDIATIPFLALSFFSFSSFIKRQKLKDLLLASLFLSLGIFVKNTVLWIFILYFLWIIALAYKKGAPAKNLLVKFLILTGPALLAILINFLLLLTKSTFYFTFHWAIIMAYIVFPRLPSLTRFISLSYFPIIIILLGFYFLSCLAIANLSRKSSEEKWFLCTFAFAAFASIFPRWSDFHLQPFVFFLSIIFTYALWLNKFKTGRDSRNFNVSLNVLIILMSAVIGNRILGEINLAKLSKIDQVREFTQSGLSQELKGNSVFAYDSPLYNHSPLAVTTDSNFLAISKLMILNPDLYYRVISPRAALSHAQNKNPDFIIVPFQIQDRITKGMGLTEFEKFLIEKYHQESMLGQVYIFYRRNQN